MCEGIRHAERSAKILQYVVARNFRAFSKTQEIALLGPQNDDAAIRKLSLLILTRVGTTHLQETPLSGPLVTP